MFKRSSVQVLFLLLSLLSLCVSAKNIQYVSDELTIPMRSGTTTGHKILKFLNSGVALEVLELNDEKTHALVTLLDDGSKSGWVEVGMLMATQSARQQLEAMNASMQTVKARQRDAKKQLEDSRSENTKLQSNQSQLERKIQQLTKTLKNLREKASDPIRVAEENERLEQQLVDANTKVDELMEENTILSDENIKQWFLIGAAVSIGSLVLGVALTRIRWRKKESWGANY